MSAAFLLSERLFDCVDGTGKNGLTDPVVEPIDAGALSSIAVRMEENLAAGSTLAVTVERFDP